MREVCANKSTGGRKSDKMNQARRNMERTYKRSQQGMVMALNEVFKMRKMKLTLQESGKEKRLSSYSSSKIRGALMLVFNKNSKKFVSDLK